MSGIKAIIFDKDGTLFHFQATWGGAVLRLLEQVAPGELRTAAAAVLNVDPVTGLFAPTSLAITGTTGDVARALAPVTGMAEAEIVAIADRIGAAAPQVPAVDLQRCLGTLGAGRVLGLVTNDSEGPARAHLAASGIAGFFDFVAGYDSGHGAKPGPGQLLAFARATGADPRATLMVGDSRHDLNAGRAAGMLTAGVLTGVATASDLEDLADVVVPDISHLDQWIAGRTVG